MADTVFKKASQTNISPAGEAWKLFPAERENMESLWKDARAVALRDGFIEQADLQKPRPGSRKKLEVYFRTFHGTVKKRPVHDGIWLRAYPLLSPDGLSWEARLDVFYFFPLGGSLEFEYVKNPVLTVKYSLENQDQSDYVTLSFSRENRTLRRTHLDEKCITRHITIDIDRFERDMPPDRKPGQQQGSRERPERSHGRKRRRIVDDSDEERGAVNVPDGPSASGQSGNKAGAATESKALGDDHEENGGQNGYKAQIQELQKRNKALEDHVREQAVEMTDLRLRLRMAGSL